MRRRIGGLAALGWLILAAPLGAATSRDVAAGQQIFDARCAWCHGAAGSGGTGPDLRRATFVFRVI
jgi:mono/diheme cytochrome c family protein